MGPLVGLTTLSIFATGRLPDWASMWLMAISLYGGFKWLTWQRAVREETPSLAPAGRSLAYLLSLAGHERAAIFVGRRTAAPGDGRLARRSAQRCGGSRHLLAPGLAVIYGWLAFG